MACHGDEIAHGGTLLCSRKPSPQKRTRFATVLGQSGRSRNPFCPSSGNSPKPISEVLGLSALRADFSRPSRAWLSDTSSSNPQSRQRELYQGLFPIPVRASVWRDTAAGTITPTLDLMQFVIDHTVTWVPHLPEHHLPATPHTTQRITTRTGHHAITVSLLRHDAIRSLDQPTQCHHQHGEQPLHLLDFARGMPPIITHTMEPFRQNMLDHPTDEGQRRDLFLLPVL